MARNRSRPERRAQARRARRAAEPAASGRRSALAPPALRGIAVGLLGVFLLVTAVYAASERAIGSDLWFALAAGRWVSEHRTVPRGDVFSYTHEGVPWFNQEWGAQVILYQVYRTLGGTGLVALKAAMVTAIVFTTAWIGWRRSGSLVAAIATAVAAALVCRPYLDIRPQLFTLLGTLVILALTDAYRRRPRPALLLAFPFVVFLWVNLHYGFIFGLGILGLIAGMETAKAFVPVVDDALPRRHALALLAATAVAAVVCLANPQHVHAFIFPFSIFEPDSPWQDVLEWNAFAFFSDEALNPILASWFLVAHVVALVAVLWLAPRRTDVTALALSGVTFLMAVRARRFIPLFTLVSAPLLATNLAIVRERRAETGAEFRTRGSALAAAALGLLGCLWIIREAVAAVPGFSDGLFAGMVTERVFPRGAAEFLRRNPIPARIYNLYNWGGYLMLMAPERKVFIDGRAHAVYSSDFYRENATVHFGEDGWENVLGHYDVNLIVWPSGEAASGTTLAALGAAVVASPNWTLVYADDQAAIYAHVARGRAWIDALQAGTLVAPSAHGGEGQE